MSCRMQPRIPLSAITTIVNSAPAKNTSAWQCQFFSRMTTIMLLTVFAQTDFTKAADAAPNSSPASATDLPKMPGAAGGKTFSTHKEKKQTMKPDIQVLTYPEAAKKAFDWGNLTWFAGRSLGNSTEMTVGRCVLKPGQGNPRHHHPNCTEILVVIQGRIEHTGPKGEKVKMGEGDTVTVPPNTWHQATNVNDVDAVLFIAFSSADRETVGE